MIENELSKIIIGTCIEIHRELGLLINFNIKLLKDGIHRVVNKL